MKPTRRQIIIAWVTLWLWPTENALYALGLHPLQEKRDMTRDRKLTLEEEDRANTFETNPTDPPPEATDKVRCYRVRQAGDRNGGYYDTDHKGVGDFIGDHIQEGSPGDGFLVTVEEVSKEWLDALPEFDGF